MALKGNLNAAKGKLWEGAIRRGLAKDRERLYNIAEKVLCAAENGEPWAINEVRNTLDGKPKEHVQVDQTTTHVHVNNSDSLHEKIRRTLERRTESLPPTVQ